MQKPEAQSDATTLNVSVEHRLVDGGRRLSVEQCKVLLGTDKHFDDAAVLRIRDMLYDLATITVDSLLEKQHRP